jgi:hypothetical protein
LHGGEEVFDEDLFLVDQILADTCGDGNGETFQIDVAGAVKVAPVAEVVEAKLFTEQRDDTLLVFFRSGRR